MDKYEYRVRADEIKDLIALGDYAQAAEIADTIDWRRVRSVKMLCTISDLYKINRRYEDARDLLLLAYEYRPGGRNICYALCELSIKTGELVQAIEYYKEFVLVAPKDPGRYILQYRLYEAQDVSLEERIEVLEELKRRDYREKWAYELAYLYHRVGLATRCVEECDELISMLGDGKYAIKAMELKMLHQPLSPSQQEKYDHRFDEKTEVAETPAEPEAVYSEEVYFEGEANDGQVSDSAPVPVTVSAETPETFKVTEDTQVYEPVRRELLATDPAPTSVQESVSEPEPASEQGSVSGSEFTFEQGFVSESELASGSELVSEPENEPEWESVFEPESVQEQQPETKMPETQAPEIREPEEMEIYVKTVDVGEYNTINLQAEIAQSLREVLGAEQPEEELEEEPEEDFITRSIIAPMMEPDEEPFDDVEEEDVSDLMPEVEEMERTEVFFGETGNIGSVPDRTGEIVMQQMRRETGEETLQTTLAAEPPKEMAKVLAQEADGQISLVVPENQDVEKQITGQMNINDVLAEWERMKQENEEKRREEVRQHVLQQTGRMFTEFDAAARDGLLEQLEKKAAEEVAREAAERKISADEDLVIFDGEEALAEEDISADDGEIVADVALMAEGEQLADGEETVNDEISAEDEAVAEEETVTEEVAMDEETVADEEVATDEEAAAEEEVATDEEVVAEEEAATDEEAAAEEVATDEEAVAEEEVATDEEAAAEEEAATDEEAAAEEEEAAAEEETVADEEAAAGEEPVDKDDTSVDEESGDDAVSDDAVVRDEVKVRSLTKEEQELYAPFIQSKAAREQIAKAIDSISLAAYTGNVIITGEEGMDTLSLAKNMVREIQAIDSNFSGKTAKISGYALNKKSVTEVIRQLQNGALIIQSACDMDEGTVQDLYKALQQENLGVVVLMEDTRKVMNVFLRENEQLLNVFTVRVDVEALSNDSLVAFGREYAREMEYSIDDLGVLALHTRIEEKQTIDHAVTAPEVKDMVDAAIRHANKKTMKHFFDILLFKRYDEEDMIVLTERDFVRGKTG